jgi:cytochrome c553
VGQDVYRSDWCVGIIALRRPVVFVQLRLSMSQFPTPRSVILFSLLALAYIRPIHGASPPKISYNEHIQPILAENCFSCHGPDSASRKAKLRLDRFEFATARRDDLPAIAPGQPEASALVERILAKDPDEVMPPPDSHKKLKPDEIALLRRWVTEGAAYEQHWSLIAPQRPPVPALANRPSPIANPIDAFIAEKLAAQNLAPNSPEAPARLLRRVTLDLTGLPPTPAELAAFERDPSPAAYARAVDRLLDTDASAEHFARYWLDAVRYADTHGIHLDNYRSIWPYRDWVIGAFRRNLPFDQFTIEQMAGDLLPGASLDQKIASGYNRCLPTTSEGGAIPEEYEAIYAKDRVDTMSAVWLGLTTGCAACHDHKFDPIAQRDFYSLAAFFRHNTMPAMDGNVSDTKPVVFVAAAAERARWSALQGEIETQRAAQRKLAGDAAVDPELQSWLATAKALAVPPKEFDTPLHLPLVTNASAVNGPYGGATRLDEKPLVAGPAMPLRREQSDSVALLVRLAGTPSGPLVSSLDAGARGTGWEVFLDQGKIGVRLRGGRAGFEASGTASTALTPDEWHHVLFTFDSGAWANRVVDVFVDGRSATNAGNVNNVPADIVPAAPFTVGGRPDAPLAGGEVWVQDVRHYRRGFNAAQAKTASAVLEAHAALLAEAEKRTPAQTELLREHFLAAVHAPSLQAAAQIDRLLAEDATLRTRGGISLVMEEKKDGEPFAHILNRGEYTQPGEKVPAATPAALPPMPADALRNRLGLARWLVAPENPLTARVTVNRVWQQFFGIGLVESADDFGVTGSRPSHPALLDWLAVEFRESGWDYRRLVRLMVTSATYRQSAAATPALLERDPANRWLARGPRHRLDAEQLRDQALAASGLLVAKVGGYPVRPYQPEGIWEDVAMKESTTRFYRTGTGDDLYRRSIYTVWKRIAPPPAMDILNAPSREVSCVRRDRTNTPLQALVTLNEPLFVESSRSLAAHALRETRSFDSRLDAITVRLLGRKLARDERPVVRRTLDTALATYTREPATAQQLLHVGVSPPNAQLPPAELAAWTLVASQVMNLDESLTK